MTTILLYLAASNVLCFLAGCRFVTELRQRREDRRGGTLDFTGIREL